MQMITDCGVYQNGFGAAKALCVDCGKNHQLSGLQPWGCLPMSRVYGYFDFGAIAARFAGCAVSMKREDDNGKSKEKQDS